MKKKRKKIQKRSLEYYRGLSGEKKHRKKNCAKFRNKNISDTDRETIKEYKKNYYYKRKKLLDHWISFAQELENVCHSK